MLKQQRQAPKGLKLISTRGVCASLFTLRRIDQVRRKLCDVSHESENDEILAPAQTLTMRWPLIGLQNHPVPVPTLAYLNLRTFSPPKLTRSIAGRRKLPQCRFVPRPDLPLVGRLRNDGFPVANGRKRPFDLQHGNGNLRADPDIYSISNERPVLTKAAFRDSHGRRSASRASPLRSRRKIHSRESCNFDCKNVLAT